MATKSGKVTRDLGIKFPPDESEVSKLNRMLTEMQIAINDGHIVRQRYTAAAIKTVANTTTETTIIGAGRGSLTLDPNFFEEGKSLRVTASGFYSTQLVAVGITVSIKKGTTVLATTGSIVLGNNIANRAWELNTVITGYTATTVICNGLFRYLAGASGNQQAFGMVNTGAVTVNTTSEAFSVTVTWAAGVAAADSFSCSNFILEVLE